MKITADQAIQLELSYEDWTEEQRRIYMRGFIDGAHWRQQDEWVPTEEALPEKTMMVIVTCPHGVLEAKFMDGAFFIVRGAERIKLNALAWKKMPPAYTPRT